MMNKFFIACAVFLLSFQIAAASTFLDAQSGDWFYPYVEALVAVDIIDDAFDNFRPGDNLNRAEAAKVIVEAAGYEIVEPLSPTFLDVERGRWYYKYIETAAANEVVSGYASRPGYFGPGDNVTREQFSKMGVLSQDMEIVGVDEPTFPDVLSNRWSFDYIETAFSEGVFSGYDDGNFRPASEINRAEMAKMIYGFLPDDQVGPLCAVEGDNIGPVGGELSCCAGLSPYIPPGSESDDQICYEPSYMNVPSI